MRILGVDPGSRVTGFGLVEKGSGGVGCVHFGQIRPPGAMPFYERLHHIHQKIRSVMQTYLPQEMAIEDLFLARNVQSTLKLGHARGAILVAALDCGLSVFEYSPLEIKKAVVGYGQATKEQVREMVRRILCLEEVPPLDTTDALATAICHLHWVRFGEKGPVAGRP